MSRSDSEDIETEVEEYEVEAIRKHRYINEDEVEYFVKWKNYSNNDNTWEPASNLEGAKDLVDQYWAAQEEKKNKKKKATTKSKKRTNQIGELEEGEERSKRTRKKLRSPSPIFSEESLGSDNDNHNDHVAKSNSPDSDEEFGVKTRPGENGINYNEPKFGDNDDDDDEEDEDYEINSAEDDSDKMESATEDQLIEDEEEVVVEEEEEEEKEKEDTEQQSYSKKELRNLDNDDDTFDEDKIMDEDSGDDSPHMVTITMEDNGSTMKYQVIVDSKYIDNSLTWEKDVEKVINVYQEEEEHRYQGVVKWSNGTYSLHPNDELRKKCPQQLIDFYENHLYFRSN